MFAIQLKGNTKVFLGFKFHKSGNEYFPIDITKYPLGDLDSSEIYTDSGEHFSEGYNEHTLIQLIDEELKSFEDNGYEHSYSKNELVANSVFNPEEWRVVVLSLSIKPISDT